MLGCKDDHDVVACMSYAQDASPAFIGFTCGQNLLPHVMVVAKVGSFKWQCIAVNFVSI